MSRNALNLNFIKLQYEDFTSCIFIFIEHKWFERGVKEAIYIQAMNPSLNRDGGRYNLPPVWNNIIKEKLTENGAGTTNGGGARPEDFW